MAKGEEEYDAFPNAPGLSKDLSLRRKTDADFAPRGWGPTRRKWFSICSTHYPSRSDCPRCSCGRWVNMWHNAFSGVVFAVCPPLWRVIRNNRYLAWILK